MSDTPTPPGEPEREPDAREESAYDPVANPLAGNVSGAREVQIRQRAIQIVEMRKAGYTLWQIGDRFGLTDKRVSQIISNELKRTSHSAAQSLKELITAQRFDIIRTYWPIARALPYIVNQDGKDVEVARKVDDEAFRAAAVIDRQLEALARLWGLEKLVIEAGRSQEERADALYQQIMAYKQGRLDAASEPITLIPTNGDTPADGESGVS